MQNCIVLCLLFCVTILVSAQNTYNLCNLFFELDCEQSIGFVFRRSTFGCEGSTTCVNDISSVLNTSATCLSANTAIPATTATQLTLPLPAGDYVTSFVYADVNCQAPYGDTPISFQPLMTCTAIPFIGRPQKLIQNATHVFTTTYSDTNCNVLLVEAALQKGQCTYEAGQYAIVNVLSTTGGGGGSQSHANSIFSQLATMLLVSSVLIACL